MLEKYEVIVVGGGHAGTEAALAAARSGCKTLLLTQNLDTIGQMSCNPAIGGIGKSHLVKEIDALGGVMALATDLAGIQFRELNGRKGPAVRATRAQADRQLYKQAIRAALDRQPGLSLLQQTVDDLMVENGRVTGVVTQMGLTIKAPQVVLTVGTFLGGIIHVGLEHQSGGRAGDAASVRLADRLRELPFKVGRLKTGTPPRIDSSSVDFSVLEEQPGDYPEPVMSYLGSVSMHPRQVLCHIARTNETTHGIISENLDKSPLFTGVIDGIGPRYCPSIEDKVVRFAERNQHQIFIEPEGLDNTELYPNGLSTSLPFSVQCEFVRSMKGFESAVLTRPGYAIEYDYFEPRDLLYSLETRHLGGLYFAGQINGTTGYEEAAAQGLLAGINAARAARELPAWCPSRDQAYLGVMVDDLITQGTREPYRMFTSRAEYRLLLRQDNADRRLTSIGRDLGLVSDERWQRYNEKWSNIENRKRQLAGTRVTSQSEQANKLEKQFDIVLQREYGLVELLKRPEIHLHQLIDLMQLHTKDPEADQQVEIDIKYEGYIRRQEQEIERQKRYETTPIPADLEYQQLPGLSNEVRQKLLEVAPETLGQASRIPGMTPAAISLLLVHLKKLSYQVEKQGNRTTISQLSTGVRSAVLSE